MKICSADQFRWLDSYTIDTEPILSIDLMERACEAFVDWIEENIPSGSTFLVYAGPGNNGGDAMGIARLLYQSSYSVSIILCHFGKSISKDAAINLEKARTCDGLSIKNFDVEPGHHHFDYIIDGVFGSGISRKIGEPFTHVIAQMNDCGIPIISIDVPSGLKLDQSSVEPICTSTYTVTFQGPKLSLLLSQNHKYVGQWVSIDIGLSSQGIEQIDTPYFYLDLELVKTHYRKKSKYDHKGTNGRCLIVAGNHLMTGAAVLNAKAALRSGAGLVTTHSVKAVIEVIQHHIPECLFSLDEGEYFIEQIISDAGYDAIGVGSGIGTHIKTQNSLTEFLRSSVKPLILDADALNIISNIDGLDKLPNKCIITPHPKEFEKLFGSFEDDFTRIDFIKQYCVDNQIIIILKGAHTCIGTPDGRLYFNSTGNPGMATAGSGDVLTGIIASLLGQGYNQASAALLGVYLHGLAGDFALAEKGSYEGLIASDIIESIPLAFSIINEL